MARDHFPLLENEGLVDGGSEAVSCFDRIRNARFVLIPNLAAGGCQPVGRAVQNLNDPGIDSVFDPNTV